MKVATEKNMIHIKNAQNNTADAPLVVWSHSDEQNSFTKSNPFQTCIYKA